MDFNQDEVKQRIEKYWNGRADQYDGQFGHGIFSDEEKQVWLRTLSRNIHQPKGCKILDVGCGTGFLSLLLSELGFDVTGIDFSDEMMAEADKKAKAMGLNPEFLRGDAESPPVHRGVYNAVISRHVLWTLPDPEKAISSWKNLLSPGGQIIVIDGVWKPRNFSSKCMFKLSSVLMRLKGRVENNSWENEYMKNPGELPFMGGAEPNKVLDLYKKSGLERTSVDDMADVLRCEKKQAPLEYSVRYALGKTRYLISGFVPS